jgi:excisionase family DNA binding protein
MDDYLSVQEFASKLGLSRSGVIRLIEKKIISAEKLGSIYLIKPSELEKAKNRPNRGRPWPKKND